MGFVASWRRSLDFTGPDIGGVVSIGSVDDDIYAQQSGG